MNHHGKELKSKTYMYNRVTFLYSRNKYNILSKLYLNKIKKQNKTSHLLLLSSSSSLSLCLFLVWPLHKPSTPTSAQLRMPVLAFAQWLSLCFLPTGRMEVKSIGSQMLRSASSSNCPSPLVSRQETQKVPCSLTWRSGRGPSPWKLPAYKKSSVSGW